MSQAVRARTIVLPGGRIEISAPELHDGAPVEVVVLQDGGVARESADEIPGDDPSGRLFNNADKVDACIRAERDPSDR